MSVAGSVAEIWRYPVKSMGGERLARSAIAVRGLHADRMWAVRDVELDTFTTARRWPILLQCSARFAADPAGRSAAAGDVLEVIVTFPAGREVSSSDPAIHDLLSELIGKPARLESLPALSEKRRYRTPQATKADIRRQFAVPDGEPLPDFSMFPLRKLAELAVMPLRSGRYTTPTRFSWLRDRACARWPSARPARSSTFIGHPKRSARCRPILCASVKHAACPTRSTRNASTKSSSASR
jgi:uncharacterized protein YcbX